MIIEGIKWCLKGERNYQLETLVQQRWFLSMGNFPLRRDQENQVGGTKYQVTTGSETPTNKQTEERRGEEDGAKKSEQTQTHHSQALASRLGNEAEWPVTKTEAPTKGEETCRKAKKRQKNHKSLAGCREADPMAAGGLPQKKSGATAVNSPFCNEPNRATSAE